MADARGRGRWEVPMGEAFPSCEIAIPDLESARICRGVDVEALDATWGEAELTPNSDLNGEVCGWAASRVYSRDAFEKDIAGCGDSVTARDSLCCDHSVDFDADNTER